jgi:hypothetical protein
MVRSPSAPQVLPPGRLSRGRADLLSSVLLLGFLATSMTQSSIPALSNILHEKEGLSAAQVGLLMSFYFAALASLFSAAADGIAIQAALEPEAFDTSPVLAMLEKAFRLLLQDVERGQPAEQVLLHKTQQ